MIQYFRAAHDPQIVLTQFFNMKVGVVALAIPNGDINILCFQINSSIKCRQQDIDTGIGRIKAMQTRSQPLRPKGGQAGYR